MKNQWKKMSLIGFAMLALAGCHNSKSNSVPDNTAQIQQDLSQAADSASDSLAQLAEIEKARYQNDVVLPFANIHDQDLDKFITVTWYGPIAPLLQQVADMIGYQLQVYGKPPQTPILVNIDDSSQKTTAINIIRNADLQAGQNASIIILPDEKLISLRYL